MNDTTKEKKGLLAIVALIVLGEVLIAGFAIFHGINADAATLVGVIATGLAAFGKDIIAALRGYSMSAQLSKVTDQLAASSPANDNSVPKDAADGARQAADAADSKATTLEEKSA